MSEYPELFESKQVTARKDHICCECGVTIQKSTKYQVLSGLWDGDFSTFKQCKRCAVIYKAAQIVEADKGGDGIELGNLREWFYKHMSINFKGSEFVQEMARDIGCSPIELADFLEIDL